MPQSSRRYFATIHASRRHRNIVLGSGLALGSAAVFLVTQVPLGAGWRAVVAAAWTALTGVELGVLASMYRGLDGYRIEASGRVTLHAAGKPGTAASLLPGSVVLSRVAWLRFGKPSGASWGELVTLRTQDANDWRRLQVICRQLAAC